MDYSTFNKRSKIGMATAAKYRQDMPPPGGFKPLDYSRVPARKLIGGKALILGQLACTAGGFYLYNLNYKKVEMEKVEVRSSMLAILPMLQAERDREYLKQLRRNRDEEERLMANVEGWEVGKYKGEPIYKTYDPDKLVKPNMSEYYAHASGKSLKEHRDIMLWQ